MAQGMYGTKKKFLYQKQLGHKFIYDSVHEEWLCGHVAEPTNDALEIIQKSFYRSLPALNYSPLNIPNYVPLKGA